MLSVVSSKLSISFSGLIVAFNWRLSVALSGAQFWAFVESVARSHRALAPDIFFFFIISTLKEVKFFDILSSTVKLHNLNTKCPYMYRYYSLNGVLLVGFALQGLFTPR